MPIGGGARKSFCTATKAIAGKRRRSHGPTTVAVALQPRKVVKRRLSATTQKEPPPRARHQRGTGIARSTMTSKATNSNKGKRTEHNCSSGIGSCCSSHSQRFGSRFPATSTTSTSEPVTFSMLPGDIQARVLFSGYFDSLFVLNRLSLVSKHMYHMASSCYKEMDLSRLPKLGIDALSHIESRFKGIRKLDMSFCDAVNDEAVINLFPLEGTLTSLILRGCHVSDMGLEAIGKFTQLECLDISKQYEEQSLIVTDYGLVALSKLRRLREISLAWNKCVTDDGVASLIGASQGVKQLRVLDLSCCMGLTDAVCESLVGQPLERLSFLGCPMITDQSLGMLFASESLSAPYSYYPYHYPDLSPSRSSQSLPALPLTPSAVSAAGNTPFAATPIAAALTRSSSSPLPSSSAASSFPTSSITSLSLAHCEALTDVGVEILMTLPNLVDLDMRDCRRLSEEGRSKLQKWLPVASVGLS